MKRASLGAAVVALAAVVAAALASAAAPTNGRLIVSNPATNVGTAGNISISTIQAPGTYRTTVYIPAGYRAPGNFGATGNNVGKAHIFVKQADGSRVTLNGSLTYVDPARYSPGTTCSAQSTTHAAIWLLAAKQTKGTLQTTLPIFVDTQQTNPNLPASEYASLQWCAGSTGLNVTEVDLDLVRMFVNPEARGMYMWRAVYDPAASDGKSVAAGSGVMAASAVPINPQVTLGISHRRSSRYATFAGRVSVVNQPLGHAKVQLFVGHDRHLNLSKPDAVVRSKADGSYRVTIRLKGRAPWYARAKASSPYQDVTAAGGCASAQDSSLAPKGCVDATLAPFIVVSNPLKRF